MDGRKPRKDRNETNNQTGDDDTITEPETHEHPNPSTTQNLPSDNVEEPNQAPKETDYDIPTTSEEYESMADRFSTLGITRSDLDKVIENRRTSFNKATREFLNREKKRKTEEAKNTKKQRKAPVAKKLI